MRNDNLGLGEIRNVGQIPKWVPPGGQWMRA